MAIEMNSTDDQIETDILITIPKDTAEVGKDYFELQSAYEKQTSVILHFNLPQGRHQEVSRHVVGREETKTDFIFRLEP